MRTSAGTRAGSSVRLLVHSSTHPAHGHCWRSCCALAPDFTPSSQVRLSRVLSGDSVTSVAETGRSVGLIRSQKLKGFPFQGQNIAEPCLPSGAPGGGGEARWGPHEASFTGSRCPSTRTPFF